MNTTATFLAGVLVGAILVAAGEADVVVRTVWEVVDER